MPSVAPPQGGKPPQGQRVPDTNTTLLLPWQAKTQPRHCAWSRHVPVTPSSQAARQSSKPRRTAPLSTYHPRKQAGGRAGGWAGTGALQSLLGGHAATLLTSSSLTLETSCLDQGMGQQRYPLPQGVLVTLPALPASLSRTQMCLAYRCGIIRVMEHISQQGPAARTCCLKASGPLACVALLDRLPDCQKRSQRRFFASALASMPASPRDRGAWAAC